MSYEPALNNVKAICIQICLVDKKEDKVQYASIQRQLFHIVIYVCPPGGRGPLYYTHQYPKTLVKSIRYYCLLNN
jgi:hypothetical protein